MYQNLRENVTEMCRRYLSCDSAAQDTPVPYGGCSSCFRRRLQRFQGKGKRGNWAAFCRVMYLTIQNWQSSDFVCLTGSTNNTLHFSTDAQ